jgi:ribosomal protein L37AE/L43A
MPGNRCPECGMGMLIYNGLFILSCAECGYIAANGAFT